MFVNVTAEALLFEGYSDSLLTVGSLLAKVDLQAKEIFDLN